MTGVLCSNTFVYIKTKHRKTNNSHSSTKIELLSRSMQPPLLPFIAHSCCVALLPAKQYDTVLPAAAVPSFRLGPAGSQRSTLRSLLTDRL